jgi:uncharacterized protein
MAIHAAFTPFEPLAARLIAALGPAGTDGSHDLSHIMRVWRNAAAIAATEPAADAEMVCAAVLLHDCVAVEKDSPLRSQASRLAAERARGIVAELGWAPGRIDALAHVIEAHSFSAGIEPRTLEARILQDADRLDAIGAIGIARCFYTGGRMGSQLYDPDDPAAERRGLDDRRYAIDHFPAKLFKVADGFRTPAGQAMARARAETMRRFVADFMTEVAGGQEP